MCTPVSPHAPTQIHITMSKLSTLLTATTNWVSSHPLPSLAWIFQLYPPDLSPTPLFHVHPSTLNNHTQTRHLFHDLVWMVSAPYCSWCAATVPACCPTKTSWCRRSSQCCPSTVPKALRSGARWSGFCCGPCVWPTPWSSAVCRLTLTSLWRTTCR